MFISELEKDKFNNNQVHYWLTQGDSCAIISTPKDSEGNTISPELIHSVRFKITDPCSHRIVFEKKMDIYQTSKYIFNFLSRESSDVPCGNYDYEVEYTLQDGGVNTPNQWKFDIIPQGITEV